MPSLDNASTSTEPQKFTISCRYTMSATLNAIWPDSYPNMTFAEALEYEKTRERSGEDCAEAIAWGDDVTMSVEVTHREGNHV